MRIILDFLRSEHINLRKIRVMAKIWVLSKLKIQVIINTYLKNIAVIVFCYILIYKIKLKINNIYTETDFTNYLGLITSKLIFPLKIQQITLTITLHTNIYAPGTISFVLKT